MLNKTNPDGTYKKNDRYKNQTITQRNEKILIDQAMEAAAVLLWRFWSLLGSWT